MSVEVDGGSRGALVATLREKFVKCLRGPHLIKTVVICACFALVVQQVTACVRKLLHRPITTYTHFDFNRTLLYPSLTFCREPPYNFDKMLEYGLYAHPRYTSLWLGFNFSIPLDHLWMDITYNESEYFVHYGLNAESSNVEVRSTLGFMSGRCYTLAPRTRSASASRATGYAVNLRHSAADVATNIGLQAPGYHVYLHYYREPYTEISSEGAGLVDYLFVQAGEELDVKLSVDEYRKISSAHDPCLHDRHYSASQCMTEHVWQTVGELAGCSGPWMESVLPPCGNYTQIRNLITAYISLYADHEKWRLCPRLCHSLLYNAYVTNRQSGYWWDDVRRQRRVRTSDVQYQTQLYIHFNSMMVSVYEERYNYDWNLFLSDLGGSIGFLLGLSVIGLMKIVAKVWTGLVRPIIAAPLEGHCETVTAAVVESHPTPDFTSKCNLWNRRNDLLNQK